MKSGSIPSGVECLITLFFVVLAIAASALMLVVGAMS